MSFAQVFSAQPVYLDASLVTVEADLSKGLHSFSIVGLPDKAVEESRERVSVAIKNSGFNSPKHSNKRVLISLAPATLKKEGARFDLPIALAYLLASEEVRFDTSGILFLGELSLQGEIRPVLGTLSVAKFASTAGFHTVVVPKENAEEAALVHDITVLPAQTLSEVINHFLGTEYIEPQSETNIDIMSEIDENFVDFGDIRGQETAKRGLEIAAAGRHNVVLYGPPGTGKTMLARGLRSILPTLTFEEALEATAIHSVSGVLKKTIITKPPFRSPHHTSSHVAVVGGGTTPRPGEVTLAHRGVLFLDEFPEFERRVIDALREPLEDKVVSISRARGHVSFPANFILIAALNPSRERGETQISELDKERLKKKISGPVIDRVDMWIEVSHIEHEKLLARNERILESENIRRRIEQARSVQHKRYNSISATNSDMSVLDIDTHAKLTEEAQVLLTSAAKNLALSPRSYHRTIKLARTIADLGNTHEIEGGHILEALTYRPKDLF
jgi:magnesium chelatase family protein